MSEYAGSGLGSQARRHATLQRTRRFAFVGAMVAAVGLLVGTAVTFTAENGTDTITISSSSASVGSVLVRGTNINTMGTVALILPPTQWQSTNATVGTSPVWSPILNNAVAVTTAGDSAIIDTRGLTGKILITLSLTNAAALDASHNYFILPVNIYAQAHLTDTTTWTAANTASGDNNPILAGTPFGTQYLSTTNGYLNWTVDAGYVLELTIPTGGSIFAVNTTTLSPTFLVSTTVA